MTAAKHFRWEGAHRLPWYDGACKNLHGHSYRMTVALDGEPDARGMLIDFKEVKRILKPLVDAWDHATLIAADDAPLLAAVRGLDTKHFVLPGDTTSENLCRFVADYLGTEALDVLRRHGITTLRVRIEETETCYAELEVPVAAYTTRRSLLREAVLAP
jgi:6-pyruvoyltetrahydropterin/6-carboxytetrahydropterin synthase